MSQNNNDNDIVFGVIFVGYIISAIIFTIWVSDYEKLVHVFIIWGHIIGVGVISAIIGEIAKSYNTNETQIGNEIGNLIDFQGKIGRSEFWIPFLWIFLTVDILLLSIDILSFGWEPDYLYSDILSYSMLGGYFTIIPLLSLGAKRLHDTGRSGWWQLLIITVIGILVLIVFWAQESKVDEKNSESVNMTDEIEKLSKMHDEGVISTEEFKKAKSKILS